MSVKLKDTQVIEMRKRYVAGESLSFLAVAFDVSKTTVSQAVSGGTWAGIPGAVVVRHPPGQRPTNRPPTCHPDRRYHAKDLCLSCYHKIDDRARAHRRRGTTEEDYADRLRDQDGRCVLCQKLPSKRRLAVDHDHSTRRIRGLLCTRCNRALGAFEWDVKVLGRLILYVEAIIADRATR